MVVLSDLSGLILGIAGKRNSSWFEVKHKLSVGLLFLVTIVWTTQKKIERLTDRGSIRDHKQHSMPILSPISPNNTSLTEIDQYAPVIFHIKQHIMKVGVVMFSVMLPKKGMAWKSRSVIHAHTLYK
jgi:hypothetical protein